MDWDAIGVVAELLGAIGVIASLLYLATQIRHSREQMDRNTNPQRAGASQEFHRDFSDARWCTWTPPSFQPGISRGMEDFFQLDAEEAMRSVSCWDFEEYD